MEIPWRSGHFRSSQSGGGQAVSDWAKPVLAAQPRKLREVDANTVAVDLLDPDVNVVDVA